MWVAFSPLVFVIGAQAQAFALPQECGSAAEFQQRVQELLGHRHDVPMPEALHIVALPQGGYRLELDFDGVQRALEDTDCRALFRTAAIVVASKVDPRIAQPTAQPDTQQDSPSVIGQEIQAGADDENLAATPETPAVASEASTKKVVSSGDTAPAPREPIEASTPWSVWIAAAFGGVVGLVPKASPQIGLLGSLVRERFSLDVALQYSFPQTATRDADYSASIRAVGGRLFAGFAPIPALWLRGGPVVEWMPGRGYGSGFSHQGGSALLVGLGLEIAPHIALGGPFYVEASLGGRYALTRPSYEIAGLGEVFRVSAWAAALQLRLGLIIS